MHKKMLTSVCFQILEYFISSTKNCCYQTSIRCLMCIEVSTMAAVFEKREFICELTGKKTGGTAQVCLPDSEFGAGF